MPSSESSNLSPEGDEKHHHKQLDRDIREMVTSITNRVANFHRSGHYKEDEDEDDGVRIITLAGTNDGATLKSEVDNKPAGHHSEKKEEEALSTYVNSNFQAVNNSIMFSGSYQANDPGVNVEIVDFIEPASHHKAGKHEKKGKKKKKKEKEGSKSDGSAHHSGHSD